MLTLILALLLQIEPIPDPVPDNGFGGPLEALREMLEKRSDTEDVRYHGIRSMLQELRDRPQPDAVLFPRINNVLAEIQLMRSQLRVEQQETVGPIRQAIQMLTRLVYALIILAGVLLAVDVYRTFFRAKA